MRDFLEDDIRSEIDQIGEGGMALPLKDATDRIVDRHKELGEAARALIERRLIREASRRNIPILLGATPRAAS
ncbi:hypothetical protein [Fulvimarina endophytica]|uniref:hypothetical protein n=1 Tax=Fulvimarina endophytica TaxID=2293836 RepID=UPI0011C06A61|nr:hypothetical protein [Fulvimarina endophytica]